METKCIRCGKIRVVGKRWKEKINNQIVEYTTNVCPDPECQKIVEQQLQNKIDKINSIKEASDRRKKRNIRNKKQK